MWESTGTDLFPDDKFATVNGGKWDIDLGDMEHLIHFNVGNMFDIGSGSYGQDYLQPTAGVSPAATLLARLPALGYSRISPPEKATTKADSLPTGAPERAFTPQSNTFFMDGYPWKGMERHGEVCQLFSDAS